MSKKVFIIDAPEDCLHCELRMCIHIDKKCYQKCGLDFGTGYGVESFSAGELVDGWISDKCPLVDVDGLHVPKKVLFEDGVDYLWDTCPNCLNDNIDSSDNYCPQCGQALDWEA